MPEFRFHNIRKTDASYETLPPWVATQVAKHWHG